MNKYFCWIFYDKNLRFLVYAVVLFTIHEVNFSCLFVFFSFFLIIIISFLHTP